MFGSIKYNLTHLLDFSGRDARQTFWYYVLSLVVLNVLASLIAVIPMIGNIMGEAMNAAQSGMSEQELTEQMLRRMGPQLATYAWISLTIGLLVSLLLLAAFARRLHDSGNSGWWAGLALATKLVSLAIGIQTIGKLDQVLQSTTDPAQLEQLAAAQGQGALGLIGWIGPIIIIIFGVMKSTEGPNRYGETSVQF